MLSISRQTGRTDLYLAHGGIQRSGALVDTGPSFPIFQLSPVFRSSNKTLKEITITFVNAGLGH